MSNITDGKTVDLSIIILNYNTRRLTEQAVKSIQETANGLHCEIIVVDNSSDESEVFVHADTNVTFQDDFAGSEKDVDIRCIRVANKGFSNGCNIGASYAKGGHLLFLNSDVILRPGTLQKSFNYLTADNAIGALGVKVLLPTGEMDHGCRRGFPTPSNAFFYFAGFDRKYPKVRKFGGYRLTYLDEDTISDVDAVSGAFMMIPRHIFEKVGGFDEDFFMYGEDLDICYRIKEAGYKIVYYPEVTMLHLKGQSGLNINNANVKQYFYKSMVIFFDKHYKKRYGILMTAIVHAAIWGRSTLHKTGQDDGQKSGDPK